MVAIRKRSSTTLLTPTHSTVNAAGKQTGGAEKPKVVFATDKSQTDLAKPQVAPAIRTISRRMVVVLVREAGKQILSARDVTNISRV